MAGKLESISKLIRKYDLPYFVIPESAKHLSGIHPKPDRIWIPGSAGGGPGMTKYMLNSRTLILKQVLKFI
jgi:hypothetical protein